jgi:hypothetical protein
VTPDLTIQIPVLYLHDHVFVCHGVKIRHLKNPGREACYKKTSLKKYLVGEMALRFCSVKLARLCLAEPFPGKKLQAKPGSGPGIICQVQPQPNIKSTGGQGGQIRQAPIPQRVQVHSWAYSAPP